MKSLRTPGRPSGTGGASSLPTPRSRSSSVANNERAKTPTSSIPAVPSLPAAMKSTRPPSRTSGPSSNGVFIPTLNAPVRIESLGFEGILRYLGEIPPKQGIWAGVELNPGFAGKGKNDGSTPDGKRYFECAPMCGVFVSASKLSRATTGVSRPPSVASTAESESMSGLLSASSSSSIAGRITPSARTGRLSLATSYRSTSASGRVTPSNSLSTSTTSLGPETPAARAGRLRSLNAGITPLTKSRSQGASTEKPVPVPVVPTLPRASSATGSSIPSSLPSPTSSTASPRRIPSSSSQLSSPFNTPKPRSLVTPGSGIGMGSPHGATPRARIPSAVAMPPPPSPSKDLSDLQKTSKELQDRIRNLTGETASPPSPALSATSKDASPPSATSTSYSHSSQPVASPTRRTQSRIASGTIASRARSRSRGGSTSIPSTSAHSRPSSVASNASALSTSVSTSARAYAPRSSTPGFGPRSSTPGFGPRSSTPGFGRSISRAGADTPSSTADERLQRMQSRIAALEYENARLRDDVQEELNNANEVEELKQKLKELEELLLERPSDAAQVPSQDEDDAAESLLRSASPSKDPSAEQKLRQEVNLLTMRLDDASTKALSAHARAEQLQSTLDALQSASDAQTADLQKLQSELDSVQDALSSRETELASTKSTYAQTQSDLEEHQAEIGALKRSMSETATKHADEREKDRDMWDVERKELRSQVDELRRAGQETIALYEEKLEEMRVAGVKSSDLSSSVSSLSRSRSSVIADDEASKETASSIEHSALLEQLTYLQSKTASLSDALEDARHLHQSDLTILQNQLNQSKAQYKALKGELEERVRLAELEVGKKEREVEGERRRRGEIEEALRECGEALEEARAEVEGLRLGANGEESDDKEKAAERELEALQSELGVAQTSLKASKVEILGYKEEIAGLKHLVKELQRLQRDSARDEEDEMSENAVLRQENEVVKEENKALLREMEALKEEVKVLEEGLNVLEDEDEGKTKRREAAVNGTMKDGSPLVNGKSGGSEDVEELRKELELLKKKMADMDVKAARKTHDLNKEISELEALVETKIYREDELEQEIERLNEKLRKATSKRSGKSSSGAGDTSLSLSPSHASAPSSASRHHNSSSNGSASSHKVNGVGGAVELTPPPPSTVAPGAEPVCEICERPGHDIFSCDLLREDYVDDNPTITSATVGSGAELVGDVGDAGSTGDADVWCEECEGHGHRAEECPYAGDVF